MLFRSMTWGISEAAFALLVDLNRGELASARARLEALPGMATSENPEIRGSHCYLEAALLNAEGRPAEAVAVAEAGVEIAEAALPATLKMQLEQALEGALSAGDLQRADRLLQKLRDLRPGQLTPFAQALRDRFEARLAAASGRSEGIESRFGQAAGLFLETGMPFHRAVTLLEHAEWLAGQQRPGEGARQAAEARATFQELKARPWLERLARLEAARAGQPASAG